MKNGILYRHKNNTTVAFEVLDSAYIKEKASYRLGIVWWNIGACHSPWNMGLDPEIIEIPVANVSNWEAIDMQSGRINPALLERDTICKANT